MTGFGEAVYVAAKYTEDIVGRLQYAAPEQLTGRGPVESPAIDIWAFGVTAYALLTAILPYNEGLDAKTTEKIKRGDWDRDLVQPSKAAQETDPSAILDLLEGYFKMRAAERWSIQDVVECAWLRDHCQEIKCRTEGSMGSE